MRKSILSRCLLLLLVLILCSLPLAAGAQVSLTDTPLTLEQIRGDISAAFPEEDAAWLEKPEDVLVLDSSSGSFLVACSVRRKNADSEEGAARINYALQYNPEGINHGVSRKVYPAAPTAFLTEEDAVRAAGQAFLDAYLKANLPADYPMDALQPEGTKVSWGPINGYTMGFSILLPASCPLGPEGMELSLFWSADYNAFTTTSLSDWPLPRDVVGP